MSVVNRWVGKCSTASYSLNPGSAADCCYGVRLEASFYNKNYEYLGHYERFYL